MKRFICAALLVFAAPLAVHADAVAALKAKLDGMHSLSGGFSQTLTDKSGKVVQQSSGDFHLLRPGYFLWQSEAPYEQLVLGTPEKVWIYDPDLEQVTVQSRTPEQKNNPASLLAGDAEQIRGSFNVSESNLRGAAHFVLTPVIDENSYKEVEFVFANEALQRLAFLDKLEQTTNITFDNLVLNPKLDPEFFTFTPPEGTDVIVNE